MKNTFLKSLGILVLLFVGQLAHAQQQSGKATNTVDYKVTYDVATQLYTSWVVPNYNVPNIYNAGSTEKGATAQFTLMVPKDFVISNITDVKGVWEKSPLKLGPGQQDWSAYPALDPNFNYYIIGKTPSEADYGTFIQNIPVALFTFKGNACFGPIRALPNGSPFILAADNGFSLGVENSFYSRSGQPAGGNQNPLEQFNNISGGPASCDNTPVVSANPENATTPNGSSITTIVLANDKINENPVTIADVNLTIQEQPTNGTLTINPDGTIKYTPTGTFTGTDCYVYKICDKMLSTACDTSKVCITVQAPATQKVIYAYDDNNITSINQTVNGNLLENDKIGTGTGPLVVSTTPIQQPQHGNLTINANGTYQYKPNVDYFGNDAFQYKVCDSSIPSICDIAAVSIFVQPALSTINNSPIVLSDNVITKLNTIVYGNVSLNDKDPDSGQTLNTTIINNPANGTLILNIDGTFSYKPNTGFTGNDRFTYKTCDNGTPVLCDMAEVNISISEPSSSNLPPITNDDINFVKPDLKINGDVLLNDLDPNGGGVLTVKTTPLVNPTKGKLILNPNGSYSYTPDAGFTGIDKFVYEACNTQIPTQCSQATVFLAASSNVVLNADKSDISITKKVNKSTATLNEVITYTIIAKNLGLANATTIIVKDSLGLGLDFVSASANKGSFTGSLWSIPSLSVGDSAILTLSAKVTLEGISFNHAKLVSLTQTDLVKSNNEASVCVSVPIKLCTGDQVQLNAPVNYTNVAWFKNGTQVGSGSQLVVGTSGSYTVTATNSACPSSGCCPIVVIVADCCPANICVPISIVRKK